MKMTKLTCVFSLITLFCSITACAQQQKETAMTIYSPQPLYFHYFQIDVPKDIDLDTSIVEANFWGNRFFAYPIASQQDFTDLVNQRINVFQQHKLSQAALDYAKKRKEGLEFADDEVKRSYPDLQMTTALYKVIKYDEQHYRIIANPLSDLDRSFTANMFMQWYIYIPEQHKYIMTKQGMVPTKDVIGNQVEEKGRTFLNTQIRPLTPQILQNPKVMAVGPVAWLQPDSHPTIEYRLQSKHNKMKIHLLVDSVSKDKYDSIQYTHKELIKHIQHQSDDKARPLDSGSLTLAGMKGQERCYYVPSTDLATASNYVWCSWGTDGIKENLNSPSILLEMKYEVGSSSNDQKVALQAWQQLIQSFKRR